jgi:putative ABC transport system ATP-binding protein
VSAPVGVTLEGVAKTYATPAGPVRAVAGITLDVPPGASLAIVGPSGCGKSTLLGLIAGLETPTAGRVLIGGREVSRLSDGERVRLRREALGLVFQADNLLPFLTATENVAAQLSLAGDADGYERCSQLLEALGLAGHAGKLPDELSGGQRQRVAVARALVHRPRLVLADEPTGALDEESAAAVLDLLLAARARTGSTLVVVTHDPEVARRMDATLALRDGRPA